MPTEKQIAANRRNAEKCTGPKSLPGKAISSLNALKTGIDVKSEFMRCESREEYEQLTAEYYADFPPANAAERDLLDQIVKSAWLERRYMGVETMVWEGAFERANSRDAGAIFQRCQETFLKIERLHNSAQRNYRRALAQLLTLRKERGAGLPVREPAPEPPTQPEPTEPVNPKLVSFEDLPESPAPQSDKTLESRPSGEDSPPLAA